MDALFSSVSCLSLTPPVTLINQVQRANKPLLFGEVRLLYWRKRGAEGAPFVGNGDENTIMRRPWLLQETSGKHHIWSGNIT